MIDKMTIISDLWHLERNIVSPGIDQAFNYLKNLLPMTIHEYPTGEPIWTWIIPESWECHEAWLETIDGQRLLDYKDNPLHVISYSLPYEGEVSREVLFSHLHTHPTLPDAIPFVFKYYDRDWGLCTTQKQKESLTDPVYRICIRTTFTPSTLKVAEIIVPGVSKECFVLVAHLCHPNQVNDDLPGVAVLIDLAEKMRSGQIPYYTYRFLILPETIGSVAWLSHNETLLPDMVGGLFLEMLGNDSSHALQHSFLPDSQVDKVFRSALPAYDTQSYQAPYRTVINNDERQFNAPGVRVPMLSISRVEPSGSSTRPYREYHSSFDTPDIVSPDRLDNSSQVIFQLISAFDQNQYVVNQFKGEIFCSGQKIWIDYHINPEGHRRLFNIMERCDGEHTIADIACDLEIRFQAVFEVVSLLLDRNLVSLSRNPVVTDPHRM
jgi:aminopeptidase-like protein